MYGNFNKYNSDFMQQSEVLKDKNGNVFKFSKNKKGELRGTQIQTDKNGNLISIKYIDNNSNVQTTTYKNGEIHSKYQEKLIEGKFIRNGDYEQYQDGIVIKKGQYLNGELNGEWYILNKEKNNIEAKKYRNGEDITHKVKEELKNKIESLASETIDALAENNPTRAAQRLGRNIFLLIKAYREKEKIPQIKIDFQEIPNLQIGEAEKFYSTFYKDGSPKIFAEEAMLDMEGKIKFKGKFLEHYDNGKIKIDTNYNSNGKKEGMYKEYYDNGVLKYEGAYLNGEKIGIHKGFDKLGKEIKKETFLEKEENKKKEKIPKKKKGTLKEILNVERE